MSETQVDKRRERILSLAEKTFFQEGFYKVSLDELVSELRISKSTIYEYFGSKEGLVLAVVVDLADRLEDHLIRIGLDTSRPVRDRLLEIARFQGDIARNLRVKFMREMQVHTPEVWEEHEQRRIDRIDGYYRPLIREGIANGEFDPDIDPEFLLQVYLNMISAVSTTDLLEQVPYTRTEAYRHIIRILFDGAGKSNRVNG